MKGDKPMSGRGQNDEWPNLIKTLVVNIVNACFVCKARRGKGSRGRERIKGRGKRKKKKKQ